MNALVPLADLASVYVLGVVLVAARLSAVVTLLPGLDDATIPTPARTLIVLALAGVLSLGLGGLQVPVPAEPVALAVMVLREALIGAALGLALRLVFTAFEVAGSLAGISMGLSLNIFIDPTSGDQSLALGTLFRLGAMLVFVALDGHRMVLLTVFEHLQHFPVGQASLPLPDAATLAAQAGGMATTALQLAAPVVVVTLMLNIALAFVSRVVPSVNLFGVGLGMLLLAGLAAMGLQGDAVAVTLERALAELPRHMAEMAGGR